MSLLGTLQFQTSLCPEDVVCSRVFDAKKSCGQNKNELEPINQMDLGIFFNLPTQRESEAEEVDAVLITVDVGMTKRH